MSNWESPKYQELLEASNQEKNPKKRNQILIDAERVLMEEMPLIPLYFEDSRYVKSDQLIGATLFPSGEVDFKYAKLRCLEE